MMQKNKKHTVILESQLERLANEKRKALEAIDIAVSFSNHEISYSQLEDPIPIIRETAAHIKKLIRFQALAIYLVDEETSDFELTYSDRPNIADDFENELGFLIQNQTFFHVIQNNRPHFFMSKEKTGTLLLHVLTTPSRVRGIFVGLLDQERKSIPDTTLALITVIAASSANALESFELYKQYKNTNKRLAVKVDRRTNELREANRRMNQILSSSPVGIGMVDKKKIIWVNEAMLKIFGYTSPDEMIGKPLKEFYLSDREYRRVHASKSDILNYDVPLEFDAAMKRKNGTTFTAYVKISTEDPQFPMKKFVFVISDISWRIKAEADKRQKEKLEGVLEMAGAVCHELNQPLMSASGYTDMLLMEARGDESHLSNLVQIKAQIGRMGDITKKLMKITEYKTKKYLKGKIIDIDKSSAESTEFQKPQGE